jgi:glucose/arabinose dehydrogenase
MRRAAAPLRLAAAVLGVVAAVLAGCSSTSAQRPPDWRPSPNNPAVEPGNARVQPIVPEPTGRGGSGGGGSGGGGIGGGSAGTPSSPSTSAPAKPSDPFVVAKHLVAPVGLSLLPDGTALVGERTTGRIVRVQPRPGRPVPTVRVLHGLDTAGDGGLLDLAVSPTYAEDNLVYAYITTHTDNRVVEFTLHGPVTPVLTGIPKGPFDNTGRLLFGPDGSLYLGTGDAGRSRSAERLSSDAGKILHVSDIGRPSRDNPQHGSPVWASGVHLVDGLCRAASSEQMWEVEAGAPGRPDEINAVDRGGYYGWPTPTSSELNPAATLPRHFASPGGCAVLAGRLWVTSLDGEALLYAPIRSSAGVVKLGAFHTALGNRYGRLRTVVAASDGALWLTTSNRDGHGKPVPADERVIRWRPNVSASNGSRV